MIISIICKSSIQIGLGHLIRSYSFAEQISKTFPEIKIVFNLIGDKNFQNILTNPKIVYRFFENDSSLAITEYSDITFLDMTEIDGIALQRVKQQTSKIVLLSPVFNHLDQIDYLFSRTKYLGFSPTDYPNLKIYSSFEYTIIRENCISINAGEYERNLFSSPFPIAISMGGGDASNKTFEVVQALKKCKTRLMFWVLIGHGYNHSLDALLKEIRLHSQHEIILAHTANSMWQILKNCALCVLPGGITTYEAVFAGLPSINFSYNSSQQFLIKELVEKNAAFDFGVYSEEVLTDICSFIEGISQNPRTLLEMHVYTKYLIDGNGSIRILNTILSDGK